MWSQLNHRQVKTMGKLLFFDEGHRYEVDGEVLPSVSELCRFLTREVYESVSQYHLDRAADRGTKVHKACETLDLYGKVEISDEFAPYVAAYLQFRKEHEVQWQMIEQSMYHTEDRYAGTVDRYGLLDGVHTLVDFKTSYVVQKRLAIAQLNLYRRMLQRNGYPVDRQVILHLTKDGYKLVEIERRDDVPEALLTLHRLMEKKKRRKRSGEKSG